MTAAQRRTIEVTRQAAQEILAQTAYYRQRTLDDLLSTQWQRAVAEAANSLLQFPERGSLCQLKASRLEGMRRLAIKGFPDHAIYYFVRRESPEIVIARVVHGARDLGALLK